MSSKASVLIPLSEPPRPRKLTGSGVFDVAKVREDFPILRETVHGKPLVYLDNAATSQKPLSVIGAMNRFYLAECSNIHRGVHYLSEQATEAYEATRLKCQKLLNAKESREIIFVRGATDGINLVPATYGRKNIGARDAPFTS